MSKLPQGWVETTLGDLFDITSSKRVHQHEWTNEGVPFYRAREIKKLARSGSVDNELFISEELFKKYSSQFGAPVSGDLMVTAVGTLGECYQVREGDRFYFKDASVLWLRKQAGVDTNYIAKLFLSKFVLDQVHEGGGTTVGTYTVANAKETVVPLPPVSEQRRIVAKIDSLTGKSRRARDHLDHIPRLVEKYKQAVLAAAFRGQLIGLSTTKTELPHDRCWDLPSSWRWVHFSDVVEIASNLIKPAEIPDLPHIAPDNVEGGTGRLLPFRTIHEDGVISAKHKFFAGQVIYSKIRPYLRKAVLVDFDGACSADMYPLSPSGGDLDAAYLLYWLISEPFSGFTVEHEGRTVLPKINQQGLNQTPVPLPPLPDQLETVMRLRTAFDWIDRLASEATSARRLIDRLDQAVLAKAFRGELVPQDPEDEPASVLLGRIRTERDTAPKTRRGRRPAA